MNTHTPAPVKSKWKTWHKVLIGVVLLIFWLVGRETKKADTMAAVTTEMAKSEIADSIAMPIETALAQNWTYGEQSNKMDNIKSHFALTNSTNTLQFQFPYNGGSTFILSIRTQKGKNEMYVEASKGQFLASSMGNSYVRIKADDGKPFTATISSASDGSSNYIFIDNANKVISLIRNAKKLMIEAEFFQEGRQAIEFDVNGLIWK